VIEFNLVDPNKELLDHNKNENYKNEIKKNGNKKNGNNRQPQQDNIQPQQKLPTRDQKQKHIYQNNQKKKERNTPKQDNIQPPKSPQYWTLANKIQFNNLLLNYKTLDKDILV
jgi:hypothetical protein